MVFRRDSKVDAFQRQISALRHQLASYKLPKRIVIVDELPRRGIGKLDRRKLVARFGD